MTDNKEILVAEPAAPVTQGSIYNSLQAFQDGQRIANALASSSLVPQDYRGNVANTLVALEMAQRTGSSPMAVMQNMHVIHGRPSWSSQFVIAALNCCGLFSPLRFRVTGTGDDETCVAWAYDKHTGDELEGPPVSIKMAKDEGWYGKNGSKWKTMPQLMLRYRAAKFFGNLYAPHVLMGMHTAEEIEDVGDNYSRQSKTVNDKVAASDLDGEFIPAGAEINSKSGLGKAAADAAKKTEKPKASGGKKAEPKPEPEPKAETVTEPEPEPEQKPVDTTPEVADTGAQQDDDNDLF